jgi:predicted esterase
VLAGGDTIVDPVYPCVCRTSNPERPAFDDGAPLAWTDPDGVERCACLFVPEGASASSPRPLLVFFHGSGGGAQNAYNLTSLRSKAVSYDTTGDPGRPGFVLLSIGGRNLHWPTATPEDGPKHDIYHRDLGSPSGNPDLANFDRLVDEIAARGVVDVRRIHVVGWSNGGRFAQLVAIARHEVATPGGNRVASAAIYSGADPFNNTGADRVPSCALDPYPTSAVPIFLVGRSCDLLPCDAAQAEDLAAEGLPVEPGDVMSVWVDDLRTKVEDPNVERIIVSGLGDVVGRCSGAGLCSVEAAYINHVRWPDGVADGSGLDHEPAMLDFLRDRPLP